MGKTLNLDTLRTFLDVKGDTAARGLFDGLRIAQSPHFSQASSRPVVWLSFREVSAERPGDSLGKLIRAQIAAYLSKDQVDPLLAEYLEDAEAYVGQALSKHREGDGPQPSPTQPGHGIGRPRRWPATPRTTHTTKCLVKKE
jgi:hypothetical protein